MSAHIPHGTTPLGQPLHGSHTRRKGQFETVLDGIRLCMEDSILPGLNRLADESIRRRRTIVVTVSDLSGRYHMQFNPDGTSARVAPPIPPEAALGGHGAMEPVDLGDPGDGGVDQDDWVAETMFADPMAVSATTGESGDGTAPRAAAHDRGARAGRRFTGLFRARR